MEKRKIRLGKVLENKLQGEIPAHVPKGIQRGEFKSKNYQVCIISNSLFCDHLVQTSYAAHK